MRAFERDVLLILLACAAGASDAWSYLGLGHAFVANMTGNTVLLGLSAFTAHDTAHPLIALGCYLPGVVIAAIMTRGLEKNALWGRAVSLTLLLEGLLIACVEAAWAGVRDIPHLPTDALLGVLAFCVGMQSGAMLQLSVPGIVTTYITGTWTTMMAGVVGLFTAERSKAPGERRVFEDRILLQLAVVGMYLGAAVLAGWLFRHAPAQVGMVPTIAVLAAAVYGFARG